MTRTRLLKGKRVKKEGEMTGNELRLDEKSERLRREQRGNAINNENR